MQLKVITARFGRKRQPVQFENAEAVLELSFAVEEDGSIGDISIEHIGMAEKLLGTVKTLVLRELNIVPANGNASVALAAQAEAATIEAAPKATKARKAKEKDSEQVTVVAASPSQLAAQSANETRLISTGGERIDPAQVEVGAATVTAPVEVGAATVTAPAATAGAIDIPAGGAPVQAATPPPGSPTGPTAEELTKWVGDLVKTGKLDSGTAKAASRKFGAEKIAQIAVDKLGAYKAEIEAAVLRFASASDI